LVGARRDQVQAPLELAGRDRCRWCGARTSSSTSPGSPAPASRWRPCSHTASPDARRAAHTRGLPYTRRSTFLFRPDRRTTDNAYKGI